MSNIGNAFEHVKDNEKKTIRMMPSIIFGGWLILWLAAELITAIDMNPPWIHWGFLGLIVLFLIPEIIGAKSERKGDTFSELIWVFVQGGPARHIVGIAIGIALSFRAASIPYLFNGSENTYILDLPWWLLCAGIGGWLVRHFPGLGRRG